MIDFAGVPLAELRRRLEAVRPGAARRRMAAALCGDPRRGARALAERAQRSEDAREMERRRLWRLFARRRRLIAAGSRTVAGVDEVGVGPLAGPVVSAAVALPDVFELVGLNDSKKLSRVARERLDEGIRACALAIGIGEVPPKEIDAMNIHRASLESMRRAVVDLCDREPAEHLLVDARTIPGLDIPQTAIIQGDARDASIAAASIVAKVYRDALMREFDRELPGYGFARHMGYGTEEHLAALRRLGASHIHRRSFAPVAAAPIAAGRPR